MNVNFERRSLALGVAAGLTGAAAVATVALTNHHSTPQRVLQPLHPASELMPAMADMAGPSAAPAAKTPSAALTVAQARAIAERAGGGQAEQVSSVVAATGRSYRVEVDRSNGTEALLVIDARTGRLLSTTNEPQDGTEPAEQSSTEPAEQDSTDQEAAVTAPQDRNGD